MAEFDAGVFEVAVRERLRQDLRDRLGEVIETMKARTGPNGSFFIDPSGATAASLEVVETDPENTRGWFFSIRASTPGAFFTNLGQVLTPNQANAMRWIHHRTGETIIAHKVDMTPYKGWVREMSAELLGEIRGS